MLADDMSTYAKITIEHTRHSARATPGTGKPPKPVVTTREICVRVTPKFFIEDSGGGFSRRFDRATGFQINGQVNGYSNRVIPESAEIL